MTKVALLENSTAVDVVRSAEKLPALQPKREYGDFDAFVAKLDKLVGFDQVVSGKIERLDDVGFEWLEWDPDCRPIDLDRAKHAVGRAELNAQSAKDTLADFPQVSKRLAQVRRDAKWYDRKELYDIKGKGRHEQWTLSRRVVSEQIALLLASFQNSRPGTPKVFGKMVVEEVYANNPNACVLESACRRVRRNQSFPPSIAEMLEAIKSESTAWCDRWEVLNDEGDDDYPRRRLVDAIAEAESTIGKAQAKLAEFEAAEAKRQAAFKAAREARELEQEERRAQLERERKEREVKAAEEARRNAEWHQKTVSADACSKMHPELWDKVLVEVTHKLAAQDETTKASMRAADGLDFYIMEMVSAQLRAAANGAAQGRTP